MKKNNEVGVYVNIPKEYCDIKEELGMSWRGIIKIGIDSVERNKQYYNLVALIDKLSKENDKLRQYILKPETFNGNLEVS